MNADELLEYFDLIVEAPDSIIRLRYFILDLAVRGKLVEQDPNDEPASELFEKVSAEKARQLQEGNKRNRRAVPRFDSTDIAFDLPKGWVWTQLSEIGFINPRNAADDGVLASFIPMPMIPAKYGIRNQHELKRWGEIKNGYTHFAEGDVAIAKITPCFENGKSVVFRNLSNGIGAGTTELHVVRPITVKSEYILVFLKSPHFIQMGIPRMTGTAGQKRVPSVYFTSSPFPLPPLQEQTRIVNRVNELMVICDELASVQRVREARRDSLVAASLHRINSVSAVTKNTANKRKGANPFQEAVRFHLDNLPQFTTRADHIKQLRQTILKLAVHGKLVAQNQNDEPVSKFFGRIQAHKNKSTDGRNGRNRNREYSAETLGPREPIPKSWIWVRLGEITISRDGERIPVSKEERNSREKIYDYYGASGVIDKIDNYIFDKPLLLIGEDGANLINRSTPIAFIARGRYWVNNHAHVLDGVSERFLRYLELYINAIDLKPFVTGAAQPKMNQAKMNSIPVALPPENEQWRIVTKVDELMALCGELEDRTKTINITASRLLESILSEALITVAEDHSYKVARQEVVALG